MKTFIEHINEGIKPSAVSSKQALANEDLSKFEKLSKAKALPLKYVMFFSDEIMRDKVSAIYTTGHDEFVIKKKGKFFSGESFVTKNANEAWNYSKLCFAWDDLAESTASKLKTAIRTNPDASWLEVIKMIIDSSMTSKEAEALNVPNAMLSAKKYGL